MRRAFQISSLQGESFRWAPENMVRKERRVLDARANRKPFRRTGVTRLRGDSFDTSTQFIRYLYNTRYTALLKLVLVDSKWCVEMSKN